MESLLTFRNEYVWKLDSLFSFRLKRLYKTRLGVSRKDDFLPPRFLTLKRTGEELTNQLPPMGRLLSDYHAYRGWTEDGIPTPEKLEELCLGEE